MDLIHKSILNDDIQTLTQLLQISDNIEKRDKNGNTPLMYACTRCNIKFVSLLLEHGANPSLKNNNGWNTYMICNYFHLRNENEKYVDVLDLLTKHVN
jgi:ankyrin repeat protein